MYETDQTTDYFPYEWTRIVKLFPARTAMKPRASWFFGYGRRLPIGRLRDLVTMPQAQNLHSLLETLPDQKIKQVRSLALINYEQTVQAFRVTIIANVTAPLAILAIINQTLPGGLGRFVMNLMSGSFEGAYGLLLGAIVAAIGQMFAILYSFGCLAQSRDLKHLIDIYAVRRGMFFDLIEHPDQA